MPVCVKEGKGRCVCPVGVHLLAAPRARCTRKKSRPQHRKRGLAAEVGAKGLWDTGLTLRPPPHFRETQKIGHLFIFKLFYFSILQVHIQYKEDHRGWRKQKSIRQARCTEGTLELVGGSMGLPKAPSVCYWEGGGLRRTGNHTH